MFKLLYCHNETTPLSQVKHSLTSSFVSVDAGAHTNTFKSFSKTSHAACTSHRCLCIDIVAVSSMNLLFFLPNQLAVLLSQTGIKMFLFDSLHAFQDHHI